MLVCCRELYVYQGFPVISMEDRQHVIAIFCCDGARWGKLNYEQQGCDSQCDVRLINSFRRRIFCYQMNTFIKTVLLITERNVITSAITADTFLSSSIHHLSHLQPDQRTLIISSFVLPKTSTSELKLQLCVVINNILNQRQDTV